MSMTCRRYEKFLRLSDDVHNDKLIVIAGGVQTTATAAFKFWLTVQNLCLEWAYGRPGIIANIQVFEVAPTLNFGLNGTTVFR